MKPLHIRHMTLDDIPAVLDIDRKSFSLPWTEKSYRHELTENPSAHLLVAEKMEDRGARIVGYVGLWSIVDEAHISTLAVHPDDRSQGIGVRLLEEALSRAIELGARMATLEVRESNDVAINLYERFGFEVSGRRVGYYWDNREDAIIMSLHTLESARVPTRRGSL